MTGRLFTMAQRCFLRQRHRDDVFTKKNHWILQVIMGLVTIGSIVMSMMGMMSLLAAEWILLAILHCPTSSSREDLR